MVVTSLRVSGGPIDVSGGSLKEDKIAHIGNISKNNIMFVKKDVKAIITYI